MSSKRKAVNLTSKRAKKMPKLNEEIVKDDIDVKKKFKELELALDQDVCDSQVLHLIKDAIKSTDLPQKLSLRILKLMIKVKYHDISHELLDHQTIDLTGQEGGEVLWEAVNAGNTAVATWLIQAQANLSIRDKKNRTLLHAVLASCNIDDRVQKEKLARLMLEYGSDVNATCGEHRSVLYEAIVSKDCSCELVEELLNQGADVTIADSAHGDDLLWATNRKPTLLLKLIEHQVPDVETRNQRGAIAILHLITVSRKLRDYHEQLQMIKTILDMGVPINSFKTYVDKYRRTYPFLSTALYYEKTDMVELLVKYGADVHQKDECGRTPMYLAMRFKGSTFASRLLLEAGATIDERNDDGRYPIHSACENGSLNNIHLLLNLGADINVTDYDGYTPFDSLDKTTIAGRLVVQHLALIIAKGGTIGKKDMARLNSGFHDEHYEDCIKELERMKVTYICDGVSYFSLLTEGVSSFFILVKNRKIIKNFKQNYRKLDKLFPLYSDMLSHAFKITEMRYQLFLSEPIRVQEGYEGILPDLVIDRIAHYSRIVAVNRCQRDHYMNWYESVEIRIAEEKKFFEFSSL